jgi:hypothetical protein
MIERAQEIGAQPNQIVQSRDLLPEGATGVCGEAPSAEPEPTIDAKTLHAKIEELTLKDHSCPPRDALRGVRHRFEGTARGPVGGPKQGIDPAGKPGVGRQATMPGISRGAMSCRPRPVSCADLELMHRIGRVRREVPFAGRPKLQGLRQAVLSVGGPISLCLAPLGSAATLPVQR